MVINKGDKTNIIFVDCFDTIIFRNIRKNEVFRLWSKDLSLNYNIPWKKIYKTYKQTNFVLCLKKILTSLTLQEQFSVVLQKVFLKLSKKHCIPSSDEFISTAIQLYIQKEQSCFYLNTKLIDFLRKEKNNGKKIYLVSDFYCPSAIISLWFKELQIYNIFDAIFSSCDFNKEKATRKLYKELIKKLSISPKCVTMLGDNIWSDFLMAKSCHLNAKKIQNKEYNHEKR